ncbi:MAG: nucleoside-diphosphate kinase [Candidatus Micrarchaeota archaeon]
MRKKREVPKEELPSRYAVFFIKPEFEHLRDTIVWRIKQAGLKIAANKTTVLTEKIHEQHYVHLREKPFYNAMVDYFVDKPVEVFLLEGDDAVTKLRNLLGETDPLTAKSQSPGSLRAEYGIDKMKNVGHGSDGKEAAATEMLRFFTMAELTKKQLRFSLQHAQLDMLPSERKRVVAPQLFGMFEPHKLSPIQLRFALKYTPMKKVPQKARNYVRSVPFWQLPWRAKWRVAWWRLSGKNAS